MSARLGPSGSHSSPAVTLTPTARRFPRPAEQLAPGFASGSREPTGPPDPDQPERSVMSHLISSIDHRVATLTLTNPPQNRITAEMTDDLAHALTEIGRSDARAVVLCAEGPDFSLGGDITDWPDADLPELRTLFERHMAVFNQFEPLPVIAAVERQCRGGGFELALLADVILAGESACFGHPEQTLGLVTLLGGIYRVAERAGRSRASEWALTSEQVPAAVMAAAGVVNRVVADEALLE